MRIWQLSVVCGPDVGAIETASLDHQDRGKARRQSNNSFHSVSFVSSALERECRKVYKTGFTQPFPNVGNHKSYLGNADFEAPSRRCELAVGL